MNRLADYDWKKQAAQAAAPDEAVEKAFFQQAATFIANKAAPIMRDPYRLGFEIVQKNDDNTRMVGIFAFRISQDLYYAPAFFLNGEIKGTDLFYRHTTKTFVPLTEDWVKHLLEQDDGTIGNGIGKDQRKMSPTDTQLRRIVAPPFTYLSGIKQASEEWKVTHRTGEDEIGIDWPEFFKAASQDVAMGAVLQEFLGEETGTASFGVIADLLRKSATFAEALVSSVPTEAWMPETLGTPKQASKASGVTLYTGMLPEGMASRADEFFKKGFIIDDTRKPEETAVVSCTENMESVSDPGYYRILLKDGTHVNAFCGRRNEDDLPGCGPMSTDDYGGAVPGYPTGSQEYRQTDHRPPIIEFVTEDGRSGHGRIVMGGALKDEAGKEKTEGDQLLETMESGKMYRVYDKKRGTISRPFLVISKSKKNDLTVYKISTWSHSTGTAELKVNPDYDNVALNEGVIGSPGRFLKLKGEVKRSDGGPGYTGDDFHNWTPEKVMPGDADNFRDWVLSGEHFKEATIMHQGGEYLLRTGNKRNSEWMPKMAMLISLIGELHIPAATAEELVKDATARGRFTFYLEPAQTKVAGTIRRLLDPQFQTYHDGVFNVGVEVPQIYAVPTYTESDLPPEHRVGDAWDPGMGHGPIKNSGADDGDGLPKEVLLRASPDELAQYAQQGNIPHVFEHGVVGSLLQTFDSSALLDKYLPKMEQALDCAGRILFLFYWKPGDFQSLYGVDDMSSLENKLLSNFKSFGDLVLDLTKRTRRKNQGNAPLPK